MKNLNDKFINVNFKIETAEDIERKNFKNNADGFIDFAQAYNDLISHRKKIFKKIDSENWKI